MSLRHGAPLPPGAGPAAIGRGAPLGLRAFGHRNYRLFFGGQIVSLVGTWMQSVAQAWLVLELTNDPFWLGAVAAAQFAPVLVFGLFAGVIADALPKRRTLVATQVAMMSLALLLWVLAATGAVEIWMILLIALGLGTANAIDMPVRQSFVIEMVGRADIPNAVALNSAMFNGARIVGPAAAGLLIAATGVATAFLVNGVSFLAAIAALLSMKEEELFPPTGVAPRPRTVRAVFASLGEGLRYVRATPIVLMAVGMVGLIATFAMNFNVLIPAYARETLGLGAEGYGFLMTMTGIGSLVAALLLAFGQGPRRLVLVGGALIMGLAQIALASTEAYPLALVLNFVVGLGAISMVATANTLIQITVPDELRGRVMGLYTTVFAGSTPIGGLITGTIASTVSVPAAILVGGLAATAVALAAAAWLRFGAGGELTRLPAQPSRGAAGGAPPSDARASAVTAPMASSSQRTR